MNCKPGDLARVIGGQGPYSDRFVDVVRMYGPVLFAENLGPCWWVKPHHFAPPDCAVNAEGLFIFPDLLLRPIRDPGDDAVDEMLLRIPSPSEPVT